jgi:hypothetical protein
VTKSIDEQMNQPVNQLEVLNSEYNTLYNL